MGTLDSTHSYLQVNLNHTLRDPQPSVGKVTFTLNHDIDVDAIGAEMRTADYLSSIQKEQARKMEGEA